MEFIPQTATLEDVKGHADATFKFGRGTLLFHPPNFLSEKIKTSTHVLTEVVEEVRKKVRDSNKAFDEADRANEITSKEELHKVNFLRAIS